MGVDTKAPPLRTAASLVTDVLSDLQLLIEQQFQLTRCEIEDELRQRVTPAVIFGAGLANWLVSLMLASLAAANGIHSAMLPTPKVSTGLQLWGYQLGVTRMKVRSSVNFVESPWEHSAGLLRIWSLARCRR